MPNGDLNLHSRHSFQRGPSRRGDGKRGGMGLTKRFQPWGASRPVHQLQPLGHSSFPAGRLQRPPPRVAIQAVVTSFFGVPNCSILFQRRRNLFLVSQSEPFWATRFPRQPAARTATPDDYGDEADRIANSVAAQFPLPRPAAVVARSAKSMYPSP